mgnify:CR=1 FL=1
MEDDKEFQDFLDEMSEEIRKTSKIKALYNTIRYYINQGIEEVKFAFQRAFRGFDDGAVWSVDAYLATLIPKLLRELKERNVGVPGDVFKEGDFKESGEVVSQEILEQRAEEWNVILTDIIEGFEEYSRVQECVGLHPDRDLKKFKKAMKLFSKYYRSLWW